ncbi:MAG: hypothetical protein QNJ42_22040 [Crocosphaera sp.]|nr:hypothetical protein [Crocosphaera sp.]
MKHWLFTLTLCFNCVDYFLFNQLLLAQEHYIDRLENSIFYLPDGEVIALSKGRYQTQNTVFRLNQTLVRGDINDDQLEDFFVILTELHQGIQVNNYIAVFLGSHQGNLKNVDTLIIDNQIQFKNMTFQNKILTVEFLTDNPRQQKQLSYQFDNQSKTLVPLIIETEKTPQETIIIERDSNQIEDNNRIQIQF